MLECPSTLQVPEYPSALSAWVSQVLECPNLQVPLVPECSSTFREPECPSTFWMPLECPWGERGGGGGARGLRLPLECSLSVQFPFECSLSKRVWRKTRKKFAETQIFNYFITSYKTDREPTATSSSISFIYKKLLQTLGKSNCHVKEFFLVKFFIGAFR